MQSPIALSPDGRWAYTADSDPSVSVIDVDSRVARARIPLPATPGSVAVTPDGRRLYMLAPANNRLIVLTLVDSRVETSIKVGDWPYDLAAHPGGSLVFVSCAGSKSVRAVDAATQRVNTVIESDSRPFGMAVTRDGRWLYVCNIPRGHISLLDTTSLRVLRSVKVGEVPIEVIVQE
jgi:YVTN family beta-propeller protein